MPGLIPPTRSTTMVEILDRIGSGEQIGHYETTMATTDGQAVAISLTVSPVHDASDVIVGASPSAPEHSEKERAEEQLGSAWRSARSLIEASLDPLVTTSPGGKITDVNEATVRITGVERDRLVGSEFVDYFTEPDKARTAYRVALGDGFVADCPLTLRHTDGSLTEVLYNASVQTDVGGNVTGVGAVVRDVTERKKAEQLQSEVVLRLNELDSAKADFVSRVSHELRSPLTSVLGYLELLQEGEFGGLNDEQRRMLGIMDRNSRRLLSLVEDLLTMERVEAGAFPMHMSRVRFPSIVDRVMHLVGLEIDRRGLKCTVSVDSGIELDADPDQLERMLANLVSNCIKFTPPGGQLTIGACTDAAHAVVTVQDSGIGVPVEEQAKLFTRFFRSSASEMLETQGAGLGLFIVKQIVEAHGGAVEAVSTPGEGTTVTVRLPLRHA